MATRTSLMDFQIPRIVHEEINEDRGVFVIEPLDRGFGYTFGNSLRRVLLSSLEGAAVTAVKIEGVAHEFTTLPGVREDVTDIILTPIVRYDLPADYFNQSTSSVLAVTRDDVLRVARQYIDPDNITIFIVGDRAKIEAQVRQQNLGDITLMTVVDVLGPVPVVR